MLKSKMPPLFFNQSPSQNIWKALIILILGLILTGIATFYTHQEVESKANQEFSAICNEIRIRTANRIQECEKLLRTSSSFITTADTVTRGEWKSFYEYSDYEKNLPGVEGLGYSILIPKNQLQQHISKVKKEGFPGYIVKPVGERDLYTSIIYIEPFKGRNIQAIGYDLFSEPIRRKAMELARDSNVAVLSGNIKNLEQVEKGQHKGILMVLPVYRKGMTLNSVDQRRAAIKGWVYSPYRMYTLLPGILGRWDIDQGRKIHLQIYEESISDSLLLYDSQRKNLPINNGQRCRTLILPVNLNMGKWILYFTQDTSQFPNLQSSEILVALGGLIISLLLFLLAFSFLNTRFRAQQIAGQLTSKLKKSRKRLLEVLENSQDASYKRNIQKDNYNYLSPVFENLTGYSTTEMKELPFDTFLTMLHPDDKDAVNKIVTNSLSNKSPNGFQIDYRFRHKDGEYRWLRDRFNVLFNRANKPIARIGSKSDITQRKIATQFLRASEEKYRSIFETIQDVFYQVDLNGKILEISPSIINYTEYTREELIGTSVQDLYLNPSDRGTLIDNIFQRGEIQDYEVKIKGKHGVIIDTSISSRIVADADGIPIYITGIIRDISERKQKEEELKRSEENYRNIFNNSLEGMVRTSMEGRSLTANPAMALMLGFDTPEEAISAVNVSGHKLWVDPEVRSRFVDLLKEQGFVRGFECEWRRKDGSTLWISFTARIVKDLHGASPYSEGFVVDITERRKAIQALQESEERHRTILQTAMDGFWISDMKGRILDVNETYCQMLGYRMDELLSMTIPDVEAVENEDEVTSHIEQIKTQGENIFETRHRRKDGSLVDVQISAKFQPLEGGRFVVFIHDITNRKNAEKEQRKIQALLSISQRMSHLGSWETELTTGNLLWTEEMYRILGFPTNIPMDLKLASTVFPPEELIRLNNAINDALHNHAPYNIDYTIRRPDGEMRIIHDEGEVSFDKEGIPIRMFGTTQDITERKESEKQLKLLGTAIAQSPVSVVITDKEGNIEYINPKFSEVTGYSLVEAKGKNPRILKSDLQDNEFYRNLWKTILSGNIWQGEFCNKKKNGDYYWESAVISPIVDSNGQISFFVAVKEDITDKKKIMADLIRAKERAEESDNLKTSFLNNISHEIRTPFNSILGFLSLLQYEDTTLPEREEYISNINNSADRLMNTINDIVEIAQVQSGQMILTVKTIEIKSLINDLVSRFKPQAEFKGLAFNSTNQLPASIDLLKTDPAKLFTILSHLIGNAIKFTKSGSVSLSVRQIEGYIEFCVKDTGIGVSQNKQQSIFRIFTQADNSNTRQFEGAGLGLSIAVAYAGILNGKLRLESAEGAGSSFYLTIPTSDLQIKKMSDPDIIPENATRTSTGKLKILVADDDEQSAIYLSIVTKSIAREILIVKSGIEAVDAFRNSPDIDLIFMDIRMADMDGYEATRQIRQLNSEVIIFAQTAYALTGDREKTLGAGCNEYIAKPIRRENLLALVEKYFRVNQNFENHWMP